MPHDPEFSGGSIAIVVIFISKLLTIFIEGAKMPHVICDFA